MKFISAVFLFTCLFNSHYFADEQSTSNNKNSRYSGPIIDMHVHAYNESIGGMMFGMELFNPLTNMRYMAVKTPEEQRIETFKQFEKHNIVLAMTSDGQLWKDFDPDTILISGRNMSLSELEQLHADGKLDAIGELNPFYGGIKADHPSQKPFFELAEKLQVPLGFHIMPGGPPGGIYKLGMNKVRVRNANPKQLEEVLVAHPSLKVYIIHGGWPYLEDMKAMLYAHPQLYLDISATNWTIPEKEVHNFIAGLVDAGFGDRIMFGSDQMVWPESISTAIEVVNNADFLSLEQKEDIFYDNAAEFLGLSDDLIKSHKEDK